MATTDPVTPAAGHSESRLLRALEALLEPGLAVLSLWALAWWHEGAVTPGWLLTSVLAFALSYPGRARLHAGFTQQA